MSSAWPGLTWSCLDLVSPTRVGFQQPVHAACLPTHLASWQVRRVICIIYYKRNLGQVPVDGVAVRGAAHVSNQHITGEALPILAEEGTELLAGALATDSWLILRATRVARESALARIAELTETAKVRLRFIPPF